MLSPELMGEAGDAVATVYTQIEAEMLAHLTATMLSGDITSKTAGELALLAQTHESELRAIIEANRDAIDAAVLDTAERLLEASDADDRSRLLSDERKAPAQIISTVAGIAEVLSRDNLAMLKGAKEAFLQASIEAVTQVNTGYLTADKAVHKAVRKLARGGIPITHVTYKDGQGNVTVRNNVDVAVRRHVRTQIAQDANRMSMERLDKLEIKLVEVSSHADARPSHAEWQGQCYSLNGEITIDDVTYKDFYLHCMSGDLGDILGGVNCRHSFGPYRHGAPRRYSPNPEHPSGLSGEEIYNLEQKQRYLERAVRADKRELMTAQEAYEQDSTLSNKTALIKAQERLKKRQETMREFIKEANARSKNPRVSVLTRKPNREWAGDMPKSKMVPASHRSVSKFLNQKSIKSQMQSAGISKTRMKAEISAEMLRRGGTTADFASLSAKEQQSIFSKVRGAIDSKLPSTKKARVGVHTKPKFSLEDYLYELEGERRPMTFKQADGNRVNPNYLKKRGSTKNCQTCAAVYEARRQGWNVVARLRYNNKTMDNLAKKPERIWLDPNTWRPPTRIEHSSHNGVNNASFVNTIVGQDERYSMRYTYLGMDNKWHGHVVSAERDKHGDLFIYDGQNGRVYQGEEFKKFMERPREIGLFRVDNAILNVDIAKQVFQLGF